MKQQCVVVIGVLLLAAVAAGCGHASGQRLNPDEYLQRLRAIEAGPAASSTSRLFTKLVVEPGLPKARCEEKAREFDRNLHDVVDAVNALNPPRDVEYLQHRFVSAAKESVRAVDKAVRDVETGKVSCGRPMNSRIYGLPSTQRAVDVLDELKAKGYVLGSNSD